MKTVAPLAARGVPSPPTFLALKPSPPPPLPVRARGEMEEGGGADCNGRAGCDILGGYVSCTRFVSHRVGDRHARALCFRSLCPVGGDCRRRPSGRSAEELQIAGRQSAQGASTRIEGFGGSGC